MAVLQQLELLQPQNPLAHSACLAQPGTLQIQGFAPKKNPAYASNLGACPCHAELNFAWPVACWHLGEHPHSPTSSQEREGHGLVGPSRARPSSSSCGG